MKWQVRAPGLNNGEHACPFFVIESLFINLFFDILSIDLTGQIEDLRFSVTNNSWLIFVEPAVASIMVMLVLGLSTHKPSSLYVTVCHWTHYYH